MNLSKKSKLKIFVVILAAGKGERFWQSIEQNSYPISNQKLKNQLPKAYITINNKPIYHFSFNLLKLIASEILLVIPQNMQNLTHPCPSIIGGKSRFDSVMLALDYFKNTQDSNQAWILVHDAARVLIHTQDIQQLIDCCQKLDKQKNNKAVGVILAQKLTDTIKKKNSQDKYQSINRNHLIAAQTPQIFRFDVLYQAYKNAISLKSTITDDASAIEKMNLSYQVCLAKQPNFKITYFADFLLARQILSLKSND